MDLAVVIHTIDSYAFLWPGWHHYFRKFWDPAIQAPVYFVNESREVTFPNITQIKTGPGEWSDRLMRGLEQIPESNVFYMQEDFWPYETLPAALFGSSFDVFIRKKMDAFRIIPMANYVLRPTLTFVGKCNLKRFSNRRSYYLVTHQPGFWKKDFLQSCLVPNESPWQNELEGTERIRNRRPRIYMIKKSWYNEVCRHGKLTDTGIQMERDAGL